MAHLMRMPIGGAEAMEAPNSNKTASSEADHVDGDQPKSKHLAKRQKKKQAKKRRRLLSDAVQSIPDAVTLAESPHSADRKSRKLGGSATASICDDHGGVQPGGDAASASAADHPATSAASGDVPNTAVYSGRSPSEVFAWMIHPITPADFFRDYWEKKPLLIRRKKSKYYKDVFSAAALDDMLRQNNVKFGVNVDVTTYTDGVRETHNIPGRAHPGTLWNFYDEGCSVRCLNPQAFRPPLWHLVSSLQEYFSCMVGVNTYLTPPGTQGFSPHFDDIEAFLLQTEGTKRWRLYENPTGERLPRFSSGNFEQNELGKPIMETMLSAGDLLYFPRGFVHQANALEEDYSHHVTLSTYQLNNWGNLMEKMVQGAMETTYEDISFREGLPMNYTDYMGVQHAQSEAPERRTFIKRVKRMFELLASNAPIDAAVDQMAVDYIHGCMPTAIRPSDRQFHAKYRPGGPGGRFIVTGETDVKLASKNVARLVVEGDCANLYHTLDNGRVFKSEEPQMVTFALDHAEAVEYLLNNHAEWKPVVTLPGVDKDDQVMIASCLYDVGILLARDLPEV